MQLQTAAGDGKISLIWKNPADADLHQLEIRTELADGTLKHPVYLAATKDAACSFIAEGLKNGTAYTFTLRTIDKGLNKSKGVKSGVQQTLAGGRMMNNTLSQNPAKEIQTHEDVTITISSSTAAQEIKWMRGVKSAKKFWANGTHITSDHFSVGINGVYSVAVRDIAGRRDVETIEIKNLDKTPPAEVTQLRTAAGDGKISLSWKNPADADLHQVEICAELADGTLKHPVYLAATKDAACSFIAEGLKNGTAYTFTLRTIDKGLNKSKGAKSESAAGTKMTNTEELANILHRADEAFSRRYEEEWQSMKQPLQKESANRTPTMRRENAKYEMTAKGASLKLGNDTVFAEKIRNLMIDKKYSPYAVIQTFKNTSWPSKTRICKKTCTITFPTM